MPNVMVVIEGLDLVGKTTIARTLSQSNGWLYYKTPPQEYYEACVKLGEDGRPTYNDERFWLFIECLKYSSIEISKLLCSGISVVVDRWLWTTLAYHFAFNPGLEKKWKEKEDKEILSLIRPNLSILVNVADKKVYEKRKENRKILTPHDKMVVDDEEKSRTIYCNFKRLNENFVFIDNSGNFDLTMDIVWKYISAIK